MKPLRFLSIYCYVCVFEIRGQSRFLFRFSVVFLPKISRNWFVHKNARNLVWFFSFLFFSEIFYLATHMYGSTITLLIQIHLAWQLRYKLHTLPRKHVLNQGKCWKDDKELPLRRGKTTWYPLRPEKIFLLRAFGRPQLLNVIHKNSSTQIFFLFLTSTVWATSSLLLRFLIPVG